MSLSTPGHRARGPAEGRCSLQQAPTRPVSSSLGFPQESSQLLIDLDGHRQLCITVEPSVGHLEERERRRQKAWLWWLEQRFGESWVFPSAHSPARELTDCGWFYMAYAVSLSMV